MRSFRLLVLYDLLVPESVGGVELRNAALGAALAARGHSVTLAGPTDQPAGTVDAGFTVEPLAPRWRGIETPGRRTARDAGRYAALMRHVDVERFDAVETANIPYAHLPAIARRGRRAGRPLLVTWHEIWGGAWKDYLGRSLRPAWPWFALAERWLTRFGAAAITPSRLTAGRLPGAARRRAHVVPGGVWNDEMRRVAADRSASPLVTVNRLIADKRTDLLLRAVSILARDAAPAPILDVIGDGPERPRLERLADELGLGARVRFLGRMARQNDVWAVLAGARVAVQPSAREGFGLFALEALALGVPVVHVASPRSAVGEIVRHEVDGLESAPDAEALAAALGRLLADPARRSALAQTARNRAADFDWSVQAQRLETVVRAAIGSGERVSPTQ